MTVIMDFESGKLLSLRRRAGAIGCKVLDGQQPNLRLGDGAGEYTLVDIHTDELVRVPGVAIVLLEIQIRQLGGKTCSIRNRQQQIRGIQSRGHGTV